jgi:Cdc6-like AAA superfamily ATPase
MKLIFSSTRNNKKFTNFLIGWKYFEFNVQRSQKKGCAVIGISNTINLQDHFKIKIQSRIESTENIIFQTYTSQQISKILELRLDDLNIFEKKVCFKSILKEQGTGILFQESFRKMVFPAKFKLTN